MSSLIISIDNMSDSFEVILNHDEFQKYKQIQKNGELSAKALQDLKRDIENYKLKCEQHELTIRNYQLKIKELSKNSIRLSRRLVVEQEEHFNTQETFLAREKQLLQKILTLSNEHENNTAYLFNAREMKDKLEAQNGMLKKKIVDLERVVQKLNLQAKQAKKQQNILQDRCTSLEGEFLAVSKECTQLKTKIGQVLCDSKETKRVMTEEMQASSQAQQRKIMEITSNYEEKIKQCQDRYSDQVKKLTDQMEEINSKLHQKIQDFNLLYQYKENIQTKYDSLLLKNQVMFAKVNRLKLSIQAMKNQMKGQFKKIYQELCYYKQSIIIKQEKFLEYMNKLQLLQKMKNEQKKCQRKDQLMCAIWKKIEPDLQVILKQLRKDQIAQWQIILTLQFSRVIDQLKINLQKVLKQCFDSWLMK